MPSPIMTIIFLGTLAELFRGRAWAVVAGRAAARTSAAAPRAGRCFLVVGSFYGAGE
jgi:hypothetical protein